MRITYENREIIKKAYSQFYYSNKYNFFTTFLLVVVTIMLKLPTVISDIALCISAWSSTFAFMILFKKIYPGKKFLVHVKDRFRNKLKFSTVSIIISIQVLIAVVVIFILASKNHGIMPNFTVSSWGAFIYLFLKNLFAGSLGEELGWRGFVQNHLQKRHSPLKASITVGFWWGMWHLPIWFTTGFKGLDLIKYIIFFMIAIISISIIMTTFYNLNKTLIIPIVIHQLFNFLIGIINGDLIELINYYAMLYLIFAIALIVINPGNVLYKNIRE